MTTDTDELPSTCSGGGPIIGLPAEVATEWRGTSPPVGAVVPPGWTWGSAGGPVCDYDRACDHIQDRVRTPYGGFGWVEVGGNIGLVFECELGTAWLATDVGGVVVRRAEDASRDEARALVDAVPKEKWTAWSKRLVLTDGRLFLFDSAFEGAADPGAIASDDGAVVASPGPGTYAIATATDDDERDYMRLTRV